VDLLSLVENSFVNVVYSWSWSCMNSEFISYNHFFLISVSFFTFFEYHNHHFSLVWWFLMISPGIMLLIFAKASSHVPLKILSIEDGTVLKSFNHLLYRNKKVDFIEQFNEKLLVKQENENLQILDVSNFVLSCTINTCFYIQISHFRINFRCVHLSWQKLAEVNLWHLLHLSFFMRTNYSWHFETVLWLCGTSVESL